MCGPTSATSTILQASFPQTKECRATRHRHHNSPHHLEDNRTGKHHLGSSSLYISSLCRKKNFFFFLSFGTTTVYYITASQHTYRFYEKFCHLVFVRSPVLRKSRVLVMHACKKPRLKKPRLVCMIGNIAALSPSCVVLHLKGGVEGFWHSRDVTA